MGDLIERACEEPAPGAKLENRLARKQMDHMTKRLGTPDKAISVDGISTRPVLIAVPLARGKQFAFVSQHR